MRLWKSFIIKRRLKKDLVSLLRLIQARALIIPPELWSDAYGVGFLYGFALLLQQIYGGVPKVCQHHFAIEVLTKLAHKTANVPDLIYNDHNTEAFEEGAKIAERLFFVWMRIRHVGDVVDQSFYWTYLARAHSLEGVESFLSFVPKTTPREVRLLGLAMLDYHLISYLNQKYPASLQKRSFFGGGRSLGDRGYMSLNDA